MTGSAVDPDGSPAVPDQVPVLTSLDPVSALEPVAAPEPVAAAELVSAAELVRPVPVDPAPRSHGPSRSGGIRFWLTAAAGWAVIGYGLRGMFRHHLDTKPANIARFAVGGALIHDLFLVPIVLAIGVVVSRLVPGRVRAIVQGALIVSGSLTLFAYPLVRRYASVLHNPSSLPHDYTTNLAIVLTLVWAIAGAAMIVRVRRP